MSIYDEIEAEKLRLQQEQRLKNQKSKIAFEESEKFIPEIVNQIKNRAIYRAATNSGPIYRRGLLGGVKYIKITYKLSQDDEGEKLKMYVALHKVKNNSNIYKKLTGAINAAGFCNTNVSYYEPRHYFYISTEFNLPK